MLKRVVLAVVLLVVAPIGVAVVRTLALTPASASALASAPAVPLVAVDEPAALARLGAAIRIPTVSAPEEPPDAQAAEAFRDFLAEAFPRFHAVATREVVNGGALLFTWRGTDPARRPIVLSSHMDVVPVDPETTSRWTYPAFSGSVADGYVWGRGAFDDKGNLMATLEAAEILVASGFVPLRTIYIVIGHDEENGGTLGARRLAALLASRQVAPEFLTDEGGLIGPGTLVGIPQTAAIVGIAEKGFVSLRLTVTSGGGHSSAPPAQTAVGVLGAAVARLEAHQMPARLTEATTRTLDALAPVMPFPRRLVMANRWLFGTLLVRTMLQTPSMAATVRTTTAPTMLRAGIKDNVLPTQATAVVNFRILPGDTIDTVLAHVRDTVNDPAVRVEPLTRPPGRNPSRISPTDGEPFRRLVRTVGEVFPDALVVPNLLLGATDAAQYEALTGNIYRMSPLALESLEAVHGINERVATASYVKGVQFMARFIQNTQ